MSRWLIRMLSIGCVGATVLTLGFLVASMVEIFSHRDVYIWDCGTRKTMRTRALPERGDS